MTDKADSRPIRVILLDVDDTLLNFDACARKAMEQACQVTGVPWSRSLFDTFQEMNAGFWQQIEAGKLTLRQLWQIRWNRIFARLGIDADGQAFEQAFHGALDTTHETVSGAAQVLKDLTDQGFILYAASNGRQRQQETRLHLAGLDRYLQGIFTSEAAGANKPAAQFYNYVMNKMREPLPDLKPDQVVMIGDSLSADVRGARDAGMHALWFRKDGTDGADCSQLMQLPELVGQLPD
ncbi:HAD family hydrolase [Faecalibaculum rodentium]|jgi:YjjG family noncanonical pyrimidine nucleotidase|uniref:Noncanonical pyrimidine nucleotidase, YjjG family n=1 Tax=Faecalibaculum rodentium TaxID=1702221 RepID=A0A1Q9YIF3_9FIRM|nr:HAD-IA family hydrolase [Faecalibaculum rodentium]OLU44052.1 hypothetical protein BO223_09695 [Faecalibaculum rodentium]